MGQAGGKENSQMPCLAGHSKAYFMSAHVFSKRLNLLAFGVPLLACTRRADPKPSPGGSSIYFIITPVLRFPTPTCFILPTKHNKHRFAGCFVFPRAQKTALNSACFQLRCQFRFQGRGRDTVSPLARYTHHSLLQFPMYLAHTYTSSLSLK